MLSLGMFWLQSRSMSWTMHGAWFAFSQWPEDWVSWQLRLMMWRMWTLVYGVHPIQRKSISSDSRRQCEIRGRKLSQEFWRVHEEPQAAPPPWVTKAESRGEGGESVCSQPALLVPTDDYVNVEHESGAQAVVSKRYDTEWSILYHRWQRLEDIHTLPLVPNLRADFPDTATL